MLMSLIWLNQFESMTQLAIEPPLSHTTQVDRQASPLTRLQLMWDLITRPQ